MKFKRLIAFSLICSLALSSMGFYNLGFSQYQIALKGSKSAISTQLVADSQDPSHEFRESFKTNPNSQTRTVSYNFIHESGQYTFKVVRYGQYHSYLQKRLSQNHRKLFLDFRSLIL